MFLLATIRYLSVISSKFIQKFAQKCQYFTLIYQSVPLDNFYITLYVLKDKSAPITSNFVFIIFYFFNSITLHFLFECWGFDKSEGRYSFKKYFYQLWEVNRETERQLTSNCSWGHFVHLMPLIKSAAFEHSIYIRTVSS